MSNVQRRESNDEDTFSKEIEWSIALVKIDLWWIRCCIHEENLVLGLYTKVFDEGFVDLFVLSALAWQQKSVADLRQIFIFHVISDFDFLETSWLVINCLVDFLEHLRWNLRVWRFWLRFLGWGCWSWESLRFSRFGWLDRLGFILNRNFSRFWGFDSEGRIFLLRSFCWFCLIAWIIGRDSYHSRCRWIWR